MPSIFRALLVGWRVIWNLKDPEVRKRVLATMLRGLGDGVVTHEEWEAIGADLGVFARRG